MSNVRTLGRRFAVPALAAATLAAGLGLASPAPASSIGANEIVLAPLYTGATPRVTFLASSEVGYAWQLDAGDPGDGSPPINFATWDGTRRGTTSGMDTDYLGLVGDQLAAIAPGQQPGTNVAVDIGTGKRTTLGEGWFLGGTGDGWLERSGTTVVRHVTGGGDSSYPLPPMSAGAELDVYGRGADAQGAVIWMLEWQEMSKSRLVYLDFATGAYTNLATGKVADAVRDTELTADRVYWSEGYRLRWFDRADPTKAGSLNKGHRLDQFAVNGSDVASSAMVRVDGKTSFHVWTGKVTGPDSEVDGLAGISRVLHADGTGFAVMTGREVEDHGIYRLAPGATTLGRRVMRFGQSAPFGIEASSGRLVAVRPNEAAQVESRAVTTDADVTSLTAGKPYVLVDQVWQKQVPELSGGHSAYLDYSELKQGKVYAVVQDGTREIARYRVPNAGTGIALSGQRLLVSWCPGDDCEDNAPVAEVIDIDTGTRSRVPYTTAIFGNTISYVVPSGEIRRRNLVTGAEDVVREAGLPIGVGTLTPSQVKLAMHGDWVFWRFPGGETGAVNMVKGTRVDLTGRMDVPGIWDVRFAAGLVAWIDRSDRTVRVIDLSAGSETTLGTTRDPFRDGRSWIALSEEFLAWVAPDDRVHLVPLGKAADGSPRYLGKVDAPAFSAAAGATAYRPQIDVSRPVTAWTLTVRAANGKVVRTLHGRARSGDVRPVWNGRAATGERMADGRYTWTLTGTGIGGALRRVDGKPITGTVVLDSVAPRPRMTLAERSPSSAATKGFTVRWSANDRSARFTVAVQVRTAGGWSASKIWLRGTTKQGATYVGKVPYGLKAGRAYRITVIARDAAGNRASVSKVTTIQA